MSLKIFEKAEQLWKYYCKQIEGSSVQSARPQKWRFFLLSSPVVCLFALQFDLSSLFFGCNHCRNFVYFLGPFDRPLLFVCTVMFTTTLIVTSTLIPISWYNVSWKDKFLNCQWASVDPSGPQLPTVKCKYHSY